MACGNHNSAVKAVASGHERNRWRCGNVHYIRVRARGGQPRRQRVFQHIGGEAGILADNRAALAFKPFAEIPPEHSADFKSLFSRNAYARFAAESVRPEIFTRNSIPPAKTIKMRSTA